MSGDTASVFQRADWWTDDHATFADLVERFVASEITSHSARWYEEGVVDRALWTRAGELGLIAPSIGEAYGGSGLPRSFEALTCLGYARSGDTGWGIVIQQCVLHYIEAYGTEDQKARWLPGLASGQIVAALGMTEPAAGSDLQGIRTTAVRTKDGYSISGSKTFITNGGSADLVCLVAKTDPDARARGISLVILELDQLEGFRRGANLKKIGMKGNDTAELFFDDVRAPASALLGDTEGQGFFQMMEQLPWERAAVGLLALGAMDYVVAETVAYAQTRQAFGKRLIDQQNVRYKLAEAKTKTEVLRCFMADAIGRLDRDALDPATASMIKWWSSEVQCEVADDCVQIFGGYGFMQEYGVARQFVDSRVQKIYGGANEIMKELIARQLDGVPG